MHQLEHTVLSIPGAALAVNRDGIIVLANNAIAEMFEYSDQELIGKNIDALVPRNYRGAHSELRNAFFELPNSRSIGSGRELYGETRSGKLIPVEIGLHHVTADGETAVIASIVDISERKKQELRFRLAIDAAASAMILVDAHGVVRLANEQAYETFGYAGDELLGITIEQLVPEDQRRRHRVFRQSYAAASEKRGMGANKELFGLRSDGTKFPLEIGLSPIENDGERWVMATIIDITERKRIDDEIRKKNEDLTRLNEELASFAYSASHDLKAPFTTITGLLECITEDLDENNLTDARENAERARNITQHLSTLIEKTLRLATMDHLNETPEHVDIHQVVQNVSAACESLRRELQVDVEVALEGVFCTTQYTRVTQVLENLITNAVKYSDPEKPRRYIRIAGTKEQDGARITIEDNGIGIPEAEMNTVFEAFKRGGNHTISGTGLGLALVRKNIEHLQGRIEVDSSPKGTRFEIYIPHSRIAA